MQKFQHADWPRTRELYQTVQKTEIERIMWE